VRKQRQKKVLDWNGMEKPKNTAKHPYCFKKASGNLWISPVGRRCSGSMNLGAVGPSLGELPGALGLIARHSV